MFKGFMYQNGVLKCNLIMEFKNITILNKRVSMCMSSQDNSQCFFYKINSPFEEIKVCAQTKEE